MDFAGVIWLCQKHMPARILENGPEKGDHFSHHRPCKQEQLRQITTRAHRTPFNLGRGVYGTFWPAFYSLFLILFLHFPFT